MVARSCSQWMELAARGAKWQYKFKLTALGRTRIQGCARNHGSGGRAYDNAVPVIVNLTRFEGVGKRTRVGSGGPTWRRRRVAARQTGGTISEDAPMDEEVEVERRCRSEVVPGKPKDCPALVWAKEGSCRSLVLPVERTGRMTLWRRAA